MFSKMRKNGFTLVELLVVIAIIAILFAVILIAINPAQRFKDSRNARRLSDVGSIVGAATTYVADRRGAQLPDVPDYQCIGTKTAQDFQISAPTDSTAFWKMDEGSGNLADSAGATNNALTPVNISYGASGRFNQAITSNGSNSLMYATSQADLLPTTAITLEAWFKLNSPVSALTGSTAGLIDKGNYRMGLDRQTGSAFFEVDDALVNAPSRAWDGPAHGVYAFAVYKGKLYAGLGEAANEGKLYESSDGSSWSLVSSYPDTPNAIFSLIVYNDKLYIGQGDTGSVNGKIYSFDGANWKLEYATGTWDIRSFTVFNNKLYAGGGGANNAAEVYEFDGQNWRSLNLSSFFQNNRLYALKAYNGALYAGMGGINFSRLVRWDGGTSWANITDNSVYTAVYALEVFDGKLFFGLGAPGTNNSGGVGNYDGSTVSGGGGASTEAVYSLAVYHGKLYAGHGGNITDERKIRVYARIAAGYSWSDLYTQTAPITDDNSENIQSMIDFQGKLFVGERGDNTNPYIDGNILQFDNGQIIFSKKQLWNANQWYHIAAAWDQGSSTAHLYVNGSEDNSSSFLSASSTIEGSSNLFIVGNDHSNGTLNGSLDNTAVYNTALSADTIASHAGCYNLGQYLVSEYMGALPIDPSSSITDGSDTGYFISKDPGGVVTITAPLTEITSSVPELIKASR